MREDVSEAEVAELARTMTLKYGFAGVKMGGAKAGVVAAPGISPEEKQDRLFSFGAILKPLLQARCYVPAADLGTSSEEIRGMLESLGLGPRGEGTRRTGGFYTALTVLAAAQRAAEHLGRTLAGTTVAVEGFGDVGSSVAAEFTSRGANVVAVSTARGAIYNEKGLDVRRLLDLRSREGDRGVNGYRDAERIEKTRLLEVPVDILAPCGGYRSITEENAARVMARIVCPGSNTPSTAGAEEILHRKGIVSIPDFVANCGGVLAFLVDARPERFAREFLLERVGDKVTRLLREAGSKGLSVRVCASKTAEENFMRMKQRAEQEGERPLKRLFRCVLEVYPDPPLARVPLRWLKAWYARKTCR